MNVKTLVEVRDDRVSVQMSSGGTWTFVPDAGSEPESNGTVEGREAETFDQLPTWARNRISVLEQQLATAQEAREIETKRADSAIEALIKSQRRRGELGRKMAEVKNLVDSGAAQDWPDDAVSQIRDILNAPSALKIESKAAQDEATIEGLLDRIADLEADISRRIENTGELERQLASAQEAQETLLIERNDQLNRANAKLMDIRRIVVGQEQSEILARIQTILDAPSA